MLRTHAAGIVATLIAALLMAVPASARTDYSGQAYDILAPGEFGGLPANQFSTDQGVLYNDLTPLQGHVTAGRPEEVLPVGEVRRPGSGDAQRADRPAGPADPARQPRHPAHLRQDARRRDVRLRVGRGRGPRPAAARGPRPRLPGDARRAGHQPVRPRHLGPLVHAEQAGDRLRRQAGERPASRRQAGPAGAQRPAQLGRRHQRLRGVARAVRAEAPAREADRRDRRLRVHRLDLRQRRRQRSRQLELPRPARAPARTQGRVEGVPRPARGQRSRGADDDQEAVPVRRRAEGADAGRDGDRPGLGEHRRERRGRGHGGLAPPRVELHHRRRPSTPPTATRWR